MGYAESRTKEAMLAVIREHFAALNDPPPGTVYTINLPEPPPGLPATWRLAEVKLAPEAAP
jgi:hypothetical protein